MTANHFDFAARASELQSKLKGLEDEARRCERRREELEGERTAVEKRLQITVELQEGYAAKIADARDELERIAELAGKSAVEPAKTASAPARPPLVAGQVRAAVLRFREGTVADVAAYLRRKPAEVLPLMQAEADAGIIAFAGRKMGGSPWWDYVAPSTPGAAFEKQQEHRQQAPPMVLAEPVAGVGEGILGTLSKDVRKAARRAMAAGFALTETGSGHVMLTNGINRYTFSRTPNNPVGIARRIDAFVRNHSAQRIQRGEAVPFTGKPMGRTGKPGLDKRIAGTGRKVVKRK